MTTSCWLSSSLARRSSWRRGARKGWAGRTEPPPSPYPYPYAYPYAYAYPYLCPYPYPYP